MEEKQKMNKNAIWSCVCSLVSLIIFWWLSIAGIGLGIKALKEIKDKQEKGKVLAIIGIVVGIIALVLYFYFTVIAMK